MESIRAEIQTEMSRSRIDKNKLYDLLIKIVDNVGSQGGAGPQGLQGERGAPGPQGLQGEAGKCACKCVSSSKATSSKKSKNVSFPSVV